MFLGNDSAAPGNWSGLPYRMVFAVLTLDALFLYDTQHTAPLLTLTGFHYTTHTDVSWSPDGRRVGWASSDGFATLVELAPGELGDVLTPVQVAVLQAALAPACTAPTSAASGKADVAVATAEVASTVSAASAEAVVKVSERTPAKGDAATVVESSAVAEPRTPGGPTSSAGSTSATPRPGQPVQRTLLEIMAGKRTGSDSAFCEAGTGEQAVVPPDAAKAPATVPDENAHAGTLAASPEALVAESGSVPKKRRIAPTFLGAKI